MTEVRFYDASFEPADDVLTYSVIGAKFFDNWMFVRHHKRQTTEIPGGHIEPGESSLEAACRELMEETGAVLFTIECVATYSVKMGGQTGWGRLYYAEVTEAGPIPDISEIAEVILSEHLLVPNTYPEIQPKLFGRVQEYLASLE